MHLMKHGAYSTVIRGFSLLEMLVALAVAGILLGLAAPSFQQTLQQSRQDGRVLELQGALALARSEAIKQSSRISVCARSSNDSCGTNWDNGWIVFVDNGDNAGVIESGETILRLAATLPVGIQLSNSAVTQGVSEASQRSYVRFGPRGLSNWRGSGTFVFCDARGTEQARALNVTMSGDIRAARRDDNGVMRDAFSEPVNCKEDN